MLALVKGDPAPEAATCSLWAALHQRASIDPDRLAILSPRQPANLLSDLVQPWPTGTEPDGTGGGGRIRGRALSRLTSPACILSYLLSWVLPAPAADASYLRWSFAQLRRATMRLGSALRRRGVAPGANAVFFLPVSAEWALMLSVSALNRYTAVTLPSSALSPQPGNGSDTLQRQMSTLRPSLIVVATQEEALYIAGSVETDVCVGVCLEQFTAAAPEGWVSMAEIAAEAVDDGNTILPPPAEEEEVEEEEDDDDDDPNRSAIVVYTSGSSGMPKGCPVSSHQLLSALGLTAPRQLPLLPTPIVLVSGVSFQSRCPALTLAAWATGNAAVLDMPSEPSSGGTAESILSALATCRPVVASLLVTALPSIAASPAYSADAVRSVRMVHLTGSTITTATLAAAQRAFPRARILPTFAMTEAARTVSWETRRLPPNIHDIPSWRGIVASGLVAPGAALKVVVGGGGGGADAKSRKIARRGEVGALHMCGGSIISGYLAGTGSLDAFYTGDDGEQWFVSGDDAMIDDQGFLYVLGRSECTLRRDGEVVIPCTIEDFLQTHFQGTTVAIVNVTTSKGDTGLYAVFEPAMPATSPADIQDLVVQKLGRAHRIEGAASLGQVGFQKWPLTVGGKVSHQQLRPAIERCMASGELKDEKQLR